MIFFEKIGIFLTIFNHADIGVTIFVGAAVWAKLPAVAFGGGVQHWPGGGKKDIRWGLGRDWLGIKIAICYSGEILKVYIVLFKEHIWGLIQLFDDQV